MVEVKKKIDNLIENALKNNVFSGCSVCHFILTDNDTIRNLHYYGSASSEPSALSIDQSSVFDLASLTKPLVISLSLQTLIDDDKLALSDTLDQFFKGLPDKDGKSSITIQQLLNHTAGFPAHKPYYLDLLDVNDQERSKVLVNWILDEALVYQPGRDCLYSDLGYILLGEIIKKVANQTLDCYWKRKIIDATGLEKDLFFATQCSVDRKPFVVTGKCSWSENELSGLVHDDNCRVIGGAAGHAGLFGTAPALVSLCEKIVKMYHNSYQHPFISNENFSKNIDAAEFSRRFGFDTPTGKSSSSGRYYSKNSIGHLGFTGTSFWLDLERKAGVIFLTNRVYCGNDLDGIRELRPLVHDILMKNLRVPPGVRGERT